MIASHRSASAQFKEKGLTPTYTSSTPSEVSIEETLRVARRAFEASQQQPKMTAQEMRQQVWRNEIEWQSSRERP
jgi:hypothetical protein